MERINKSMDEHDRRDTKERRKERKRRKKQRAKKKAKKKAKKAKREALGGLDDHGGKEAEGGQQCKSSSDSSDSSNSDSDSSDSDSNRCNESRNYGHGSWRRGGGTMTGVGEGDIVVHNDN
jgi:hypothetical protein